MRCFSFWHFEVQSRRLLAELLLQTSQIRPKDRVVIIAATNRMGKPVRYEEVTRTILTMSSCVCIYP